jgi:Fe-S-cluster containining protein
MSRWWTAYDRYLAIVSGALNVTCARGCAFCCMDNPRGISGVELLGVFEALAPQQRGTADGPAARFQSLVDEHGIEDAQARSKAQLTPCMYLVAGACSVYASRPMACRMFFSVTPPAACDPTSDAQPVNPKLEPPQVLKDLLKAISHRLQLHRLPKDLRRGMSGIEAHPPLQRRRS